MLFLEFSIYRRFVMMLYVINFLSYPIYLKFLNRFRTIRLFKMTELRTHNDPQYTIEIFDANTHIRNGADSNILRLWFISGSIKSH